MFWDEFVLYSQSVVYQGRAHFAILQYITDFKLFKRIIQVNVFSLLVTNIPLKIFTFFTLCI